jgi:hypothetical protein
MSQEPEYRFDQNFGLTKTLCEAYYTALVYALGAVQDIDEKFIGPVKADQRLGFLFCYWGSVMSLAQTDLVKDAALEVGGDHIRRKINRQYWSTARKALVYGIHLGTNSDDVNVLKLKCLNSFLNLSPPA